MNNRIPQPPAGVDLDAVFGQVPLWFQRWEIFEGVFTPGLNPVSAVADRVGLPQDLSGLRVLDVGAFNCCFSFECERRQAAEVVALDFKDPRDVGFFSLRDLLGSRRVRFERGSVYNLDAGSLGEFDVVLFLGVLYHLRYPLLAFDQLRKITRGTLYVETHFQRLEDHRPALPLWQFYKGAELNGDPTNWFGPNIRAVLDGLESAGFRPRLQSTWEDRACFQAVIDGSGTIESSHEGMSEIVREGLNLATGRPPTGGGPPRRVYIDLSQTFLQPTRSGIQRVTAQLCRHWPADNLIPIRVTSSDRAIVLTSDIVRVLAESFSCPDDSWTRRIQQIGDGGGEPLARLGAGDTVLVPELFYDPARIGFYERMDDEQLRQCRFIVHDLVPIVYPWFFPPDTPMDAICSYFRLIRRVPHCGFVSEATRECYWRRLRRSHRIEGPVLTPGSDGLGPKPADMPAARALKFTVLGRIEPWKNAGLILEAFEPLLREVGGLQLAFLGKMGDLDRRIVSGFQAMAADAHSGLVHHSDPDDRIVRRHVDASRATIFLSVAEGFGLPPVESLWRGIPVIAAAGIPSLQAIGCAGVHVVEPLNTINLREAIRAFLDDAYCRQKSREAWELNLPAWDSFAREVAGWCGAGSETRAAVRAPAP